MSFDNETNHGRVSKILDFLDLIEKSALSNQASVAEIREMLQPVLDRLDLAAALDPDETVDVQRQAERPPEDEDNTLPSLAEAASGAWQTILLNEARLALNQASRFNFPSETFKDSYELATELTRVLKGHLPSRPLPKPGTHAAFNSIHEAAEKADFGDLTLAMGVFMNRLHDHLAKGM